ncbi:MAG: rRNA maturation RNase YbeY [Clostridiaceae bacterium]|nr:rRNA maturation RNase YbeY [Clostridiaceae bacterium]
MIVQFVNQQSKYAIKTWQELLAGVLPEALNETVWGRGLSGRHQDASVTVIFVGPRVMRRINRETRAVDRTTDVLSFPLLELADGRLGRPLRPEDLEWGKDGQPHIPLGEILISLDRAFEQAVEYRHGPEREVAFLGIHGLLHLLGYDHDQPEREQKMLRKQRRILRQAGLMRKLEDIHG